MDDRVGVIVYCEVRDADNIREGLYVCVLKEDRQALLSQGSQDIVGDRY